MVFTGQFSLTGGKELAARLNKLPGEIGEKMMKSASFEASVVVRDAVKKAAPKDEGRLELFIGRTAFFDRKTWQVVAKVGMVTFNGRGATLRRAKALSKLKLSTDAFYARFVNQGTEHQKPQKFFQHGFSSSMNQYASTYQDKLESKIEKYYRSISRS